jgi:hypothetical protein
MIAVYTVDDVAALLHKSRRWVLAYMRGRDFGHKAGRTRLFTEADLAQLIAELQVHSRSTPHGRKQAVPWRPPRKKDRDALAEALALATERKKDRKVREVARKAALLSTPRRKPE